MRIVVLLALLAVTIFSCKKDETLTKQDTYKNIVYRIKSSDSVLTIAFMRAVYTETVKGNIQKDSVLLKPGLFNIPATILTGVPVVLFAESKTGPNFLLQIVDENGTILAETDKITFYPANTFHPNQWVSKISVTPEG